VTKYFFLFLSFLLRSTTSLVVFDLRGRGLDLLVVVDVLRHLPDLMKREYNAGLKVALQSVKKKGTERYWCFS
jgi:hypothetical protein